MFFGQLPELVAVKIAIDMGIFDIISSDDAEFTATSIASALETETLLVGE